MADLADRFASNPLVSPTDVPASRADLRVVCVLNPAAFTFEGKTWLLLRVAEGPAASEATANALILDPASPTGVRHLEVRNDDPALDFSDPRVFRYRGQGYLTTLSHLRLASSVDGEHFVVEPRPALEGHGSLEAFGIEDCRVTSIDGEFILVYTAVSGDGFGVALASTADWQSFERKGMILAPSNKDCAIFAERIGGQYVMLHRPVASDLGGKFMWIARSPDLVHWGEHECVARTRPGMWDSLKIGAGPPPVRIPEGWLEIYHGADENDRYCLGGLLLDAADPSKVLGRSSTPIMEPLANYEIGGFYGNVVFASGAVAEGDRLNVYYGAADTIVCGATFSIRAIVERLV